MDYSNRERQFIQQGYYRIERDDRLLDVLPAQTREKGIELWEKWGRKQVIIIRLKFPFNPNKAEKFTAPRSKFELALKTNKALNLNSFK